MDYIELEWRLDGLAIRYYGQESDRNRERCDKIAWRLIRRNREGLREKIDALKYYRKSKKLVEVMKPRLKGFADTYPELEGYDACRNCDKAALEFVSAVFCGSLRNVVYAYRMYERLKMDIPPGGYKDFVPS